MQDFCKKRHAHAHETVERRPRGRRGAPGVTRFESTAKMLILRRGDISLARAGAIVTSANDSLVGNASPRYWRFAGRSNADGSVRARAGPELDAACLAIPKIPQTTIRDVQQWESTAKVGPSLHARCSVGRALVTPAFGRLDCEHVIHAVAPDAEDAYDAQYWQNNEPLRLLRETYRSALRAAAEHRAAKVSLAGLGCGVKAWPADVAAAVALDAAVATPGPRVVEFVLGFDDSVWQRWRSAARRLLGTEATSKSTEELTWVMPTCSSDRQEGRRRETDFGFASELDLEGMREISEFVAARNAPRKRRNVMCLTKDARGAGVLFIDTVQGRRKGRRDLRLPGGGFDMSAIRRSRGRK